MPLERVFVSLAFNRSPYRSASPTQTSLRAFTYEDLILRDKASLDVFWLRDESLEDSANLPPPEVIAQEIVAEDRSKRLCHKSGTGCHQCDLP